uniref:Protein unc-13 homolog C-like n=1 Tax=Saccoglossus kowalevskii TaxID=10224 RepID=A0ABM0MVW5_SACKO|nr:PREDICTED: protein unc-13 homolog C-like [Saccoglossus kowalevskii]
MGPKSDKKKSVNKGNKEDGTTHGTNSSLGGFSGSPPRKEKSASLEGEKVSLKLVYPLYKELMKKTDKHYEKVQKIQMKLNEVEERQTVAEQTITDMAEAVNNLDYRQTEIEIERISAEVEAAKMEIKELKGETIRQQRYSHSYNLRFGGIQEEEGEDPMKIIQHLIGDKFDIEPGVVENAHRIGLRAENRPPRHIIVKIIRRPVRRQILINKRKLRGSGIYVKEDLCGADFKKKKTMRPVMKEAYEKGEKVRFSNGTVYINGQRYKEN